jgi:bacterioferritin-associated ferredoxin
MWSALCVFIVAMLALGMDNGAVFQLVPQLDAEDGVFWPCPSPDHPGTPRLFLDRFSTEDGRARFHAIEHRVPAEVPDKFFPYFLMTGRASSTRQPAPSWSRAMAKLGVIIHLEKATNGILGDDCVTGLAFKDGSTLDCDMLVIAAGIRPNAEIGLRAGLTVERAIVVDNQMRSVDDANVYAVGECVQHRGRVYGLVAPLWEQSKVFADHITQRNLDAAYHGSKLATKLKVMGVELASMGITEPIGGDELIQFAEPKKGTYKKLIVRDGHLVGGIFMGDISKAAYLMQAFHRDAPLPEERLSLLFDLGSPNQKITIDEMPADMQVCDRNGVTKAALGACVAAGNRTTKAVMDATRAGKGCGSCKNLVAEVVLWFCGGEVEEDPSIHYYVPGVPLTKSATHRSCTRTEPQVRVGLAGGTEDAASKPGSPPCSRRFGMMSTRMNATPASSMPASMAISRKMVHFRSSRRCRGASARPMN